MVFLVSLIIFAKSKILAIMYKAFGNHTQFSKFINLGKIHYIHIGWKRFHFLLCYLVRIHLKTYLSFSINH